MRLGVGGRRIRRICNTEGWKEGEEMGWLDVDALAARPPRWCRYGNV